MGPTYRLAGPVSAVFEGDGKTVLVSIPLQAPDEFGAIWVGEVTARVVDLNVTLANGPGFPKSSGYFDKTGKTCKPCALNADCSANIKNACFRRYSIESKVAFMLPPGFGHKAAFDSRFKEKWYVNGAFFNKPVRPYVDDWGRLEFDWDVGHAVEDKYSLSVKLDETITDRSFNGTGVAEYTVAVPRPRVLFSKPKITLKNKTADTLEYAVELLAATNPEMAAPRRYGWFEQDVAVRAPGSTRLVILPRWKEVFTGPTGSLSITNKQVKTMGYTQKLRIQVDDAYRAERASLDIKVAIPQLDVATLVSHGPLDGDAPEQLVPPLVAVPSYKYHTKWRIHATPVMVRGSDKAGIDVVWPVKYTFQVIQGAELLASSMTAGTDAFEFMFKNKGLNLTDCIAVRVLAEDQYGHTPSSDVTMCGGLTGEEASALFADGTDLLKVLRDKMAAMPAWRRPAPGDPVAELPAKATDPLWEASRELLFGIRVVMSSMGAKNRPLSSGAFHAIVSLAPIVAKLQRLDAGFFRGSALEQRLYSGTPAQVTSMNALATRSSPQVVAMYRNGFATTTRATLLQAFPSLAAVGSKVLGQSTVQPVQTH